MLADARGHGLRFDAPPGRVVSLVPSWTEALFALGRGGHVVGATDYCVHPSGPLSGVPRVGGTKNPSLERIAALRPDLVLANREENRRRDVERLEARGIRVWVSYPRGVQEALRDLRGLGEILDAAAAAGRIAAEVEAALARAAARARPVRYAALVWYDPFMLVGPDTFADDLLGHCGGVNPLGDACGRYPRVTREVLLALDPEVVLLPTEPYAFGAAERAELLALDWRPARESRVHIVEGELLSWYGPRMARALDTFSELLHGPA